jgi:RNA polymerase-interacting CarD/CdnL/TRCF family regulator
MDWHTGDHVVHPKHGAGVVRGQQALTTNGETRDYYLIDMLTTHSTIYVDRFAVADGQPRAAITVEHLPAVIALLASKPHMLPFSAVERKACYTSV